MLSERDHKFALKRGADPPLHAATTQAPDEGSSPSEPDTTQLAGPWNAASQEDEIRRKEFTSWLLHRTRRVASVGGSRGRASLDERRAQRIEAKLQEKLALAEAKRAAGLAKLQQRAATISLRREGAAERAAAAAAERSAAAAARLDADLAAAESRRLALREAEKERLRADHELVLSRLTTSQERAATESAAQLSRLEERLRLAACTREARLARRAAKAAGKVEHARNRGAACREARQQEVESKRMALERKLEEARERRESARMVAAASPLTPRSRTSLNGLAMSPRTPGAGDGGLLQGIAAALDRDAAVGNGSPGSAASPAARGKTGAASPTLEALVLSTGEAASTRSPELVSGTGQTSGAAPQQSRQGLAPAPLRLVPGPALGHVVHLHRRHTTHSAHPPHGHQHPSTLGQLTDKQQGAAALASSPSVAVTAAMAGAGAALAPSDHAMGRGAAAAATADVADAAARLEWLRLNRSTRRLQEGWRAFAVAKKTTRALAEAFVAQKVTSVKLPSAPAHINQAAPNAPSGGDTAASGEARPGASKPVDVPGAGGSGSGSTTVWFGVGSPRKGGAGGAAPWDGGEEEAEEEGDGFERFAAALRSPATLRATQALMRRLELRLAARGVALSSAARLLRRLFPRAPRDAPLERYPPRVLLCAFMVVRYPQVVFSAGGPREMALAAASRELVTRFEALLGRLLAPSPGGAAGSPAKQGLSGLPEQGLPGEDSLPSGPPPDHLAASPVARGMAELRMQRMRRAASAGGAPLPASPAPQFVTLGELLVSFDEAWLSYLDQFVAWKGADAAALEGELVRMAAAMQASMLRKCRGDPDSERCRASSDLQTIIAQTAHDVGLLRERVAKLGGEAGLGRLEVALQAARQAVAAELAEGSASASATASEVDTDIESPSRPRPYGGAPMLGSPTRSARTPPSGAATPSGGATPRQQGAASLHAARPQGLAANAVAPATPSRLPATAPIAVPPRPQAAASPRDVPASLGAASGGESPARASLTSLSASPRTPGSLSSAALSHAPLDAVSNAAMVLDMLHAQGSYRLSASDAEGAWSRAVAAMERGFSSSAAATPLLPPPLDMAELAAMGQEQLVRSLRSRTAAIAESAFWDNVASRLGAALRGGARRGAPALPALLAPLMSEVAAEVAGLMGSTQQAAAIRSEFSKAAVATTLEGAEAGGGVGVAVQRSLGVMQRLAGLLLAAGAPAREEEALRAHRAMKQELLDAAAEWAERHGQAAAGADSDSDDEGGRAAAPPGLASALAAALRLLAAQVKLIRVDAANSRLQMLAASLPGDSAVAYLKGKFAAIFGQQQQEAVGPTAAPGAAPAAALHLPALPRTRAWLGRSTAAAAALERYLGAQGIDLRGAVAAVAAAAAAGPKADASVPAALRSGLAARPTSGSGATSLQQYPTVTPEAPVGPPGGSGGDPAWGWRWLVRCGVVALVTGDAPAVGPGLAETLLWDGERLHAAQNQFQQLLVVTAGLLLVSQLRAAAAQAGAPSAASGWGPEQRAAAGRRLLVVAADPGMRLPDLTAELSAMAGVAGDTAAEERLRGAFMSLVDPSSAAFRSLANALAASLLLHVALGHGAAASGGGEPLASRAAAALLSRVGAAALAGDVAALGGRLLSLCAVNEAVHGESYERAVAGGLEDPQAAGQGPQHQDPGPAPPSRTGQAQPQPQPPQRAAQAPGAQGGQDGESSEELEEILADGDEI